LLSATAAPVLLVGGWTWAASRQRGGFDPVVETISALAAHGADDRWLMTSALAGLGVCHLTTALAVRSAATPGRALLGLGGVATVLVAAFPQPADGGGSAPHTAAAGVAFVSLGAWPLLAGRSRSDPWPVRPATSVAAGAVLLGLVGWFFTELVADSGRVGLSERATAGSQAVWPLLVAWGSRRRS
jgi:hypothetical membrane protein